MVREQGTAYVSRSPKCAIAPHATKRSAVPSADLAGMMEKRESGKKGSQL
jgi:hypothetical protein